ncbi:hypothetical protein RhiirC2_774130 [Rhizophagus irregularis]|uniref:Uncharacterized protein n=1 Tax=Rhizophagus irregularis TaxID=588596 RepID=A0A2N1NMB5_9GLOM|nr:hypothetical protein RhiirC2_774130 [Rhizophagus irregularis]
MYHSNSTEEELDRRKEFYKNLNGEAIVDFKWKTFGRYYYFLIWFIFTTFQISFAAFLFPTITSFLWVINHNNIPNWAISLSLIRRISSFLLILVIIIASFALSFHLLLIDEFSNDIIYLMNLFIGLLNMSIERDNDRASYLVQKAEILTEIELFILFPFQRRWKHWFPEVIHYKVRKDVMRKYVREAVNNGEWKSDDEYREKVLKQIDMLDLIQ